MSRKFSINTPQTKTGHYFGLDWFRFLAALTVVFVHTRYVSFVEYGLLDESSKGMMTSAIFALSRLGNEAVIIFFVLSGFLVGGRAVERILNRTFRPNSYLIDRAVRRRTPALSGEPLCPLFSLYRTWSRV